MFKELEIVELLAMCPIFFMEQAIGAFTSEGKQQYTISFDKDEPQFDVTSHLWIDQIQDFSGKQYYMLKPFPGVGVSTQRSFTCVPVEGAEAWMKSTGTFMKCSCSYCKKGEIHPEEKK